MNEAKNNAPCCEKNNAEPSCSCLSDKGDVGNPVGRKRLKTIICFVVLLAVVSIVGYRTMGTSSNSCCIVPNDKASFNFQQLASASTSSKANAIRTDLKFSDDLKSLNELNTVAVDKDAVFIFIPDSGNVLIDDTTKTALIEIQQGLKDHNITIGLYTLLRDAPDYSEIAKQVKLPTILVARKGAGVVTVPGSNVNKSTLLQALASCDASAGGSSSCCPPK